ncbi:MAG: response regulator, partial [Gammaproteobacteria bacterium]
AYTDQRAVVDILRNDSEKFELFISDYNMPGMSGLELAQLSRELHPELPVVLLSGYITDELRKEATISGVRELVFKPNTAHELEDVIQRLTQAGKH